MALLVVVIAFAKGNERVRSKSFQKSRDRFPRRSGKDVLRVGGACDA
jgi:hypothetical protein